MKDPKPNWDAENLVSFRDPAFRRILGEQWRGPEKLDMAGMTTREEEEFLLHYGTGHGEQGTEATPESGEASRENEEALVQALRPGASV